MAPKAPKDGSGGDGQSSSTVGAVETSKTPNMALSKPKSQEISFVAFDAGSSKESRKAVRVQAAKASAAARKATIARKQAQKKKEAPLPAGRQPPVTLPPSPGSPEDITVQKGKRKRSSPEPADWRSHSGRFRPVGPLPTPGVTPTGAQIRTDYTEGVHARTVANSTHYFAASHNSRPEARSRTPPVPCQCPECNAQLQRRALGTAVPSNLHLSHYGHDSLANDDAVDAVLPPSPLSICLPSPSRVSMGRTDPFNCYPVEHHPIYDNLLHHMLTVFAPRGWPALKITTAEGLRWEHFMTQHALAEPALFLVRCLFASGDMIRLGIVDRSVSLWLQNEAVKAINEALARPERAVSDGLILAVGRIALHESMYGDRNAANVMHRPAQRRMIDIRGGMKSLDFPMLVKRLMRWADRVMSMQGATPRLLPDDEDQGNETFTTQQSVTVLEEWVPQEGRALRKKISIQDLLTD